MIELQPDKVIEKISNKKTGEIYKNDQEWKNKGISPEDIRKDVTLIMPSLDLFPKTN
jgi:ABC-type polar amino acid transport system ATPase subunit